MSVSSVGSPGVSTIATNSMTRDVQIGPGTPNMDKLMMEIDRLVAELGNKREELKAKTETAAELRKQKPTQGKDEKTEDFDKRVASWESSVASLESDIAAIESKIAQLNTDLNTANGKKAGAQSADNILQDQWSQQEKKKLEASSGSSQALGLDGQFASDSAEVVKSEVKASERKFLQGAGRTGGRGLPDGDI